MLSEQETTEIRRETERFETRQAACIEALHVVQRHRGWVDDARLADVAELLGMSVHELDGIATFYNLIYRRPVGRHVIHVCDSVSCWIMGCDGVLAHVGERLGIDPGRTTPDGRFTLLTIPCLGACDRAPAMLIDGRRHEDLDARVVDRALEACD